MKIKIQIIISIVLIILLSSFYCINYFFFMPSIQLVDSKDMTINYKEEYIETGYRAMYHNQDVTDQVKIKGKVNSKKLGTYKIEYSLKKGIFKKKAVRVVKVRDLSRPTLALEDEKKEVYVCPDEDYHIEKYNAYDNYDKDITDQVKVTQDDHIVKYAVVDSSGNYTIKSKKIIKKDNKKPSLELISGDMIFAFLNEEFQDPGYKVSDNCDKKLSVKVEGEVDTSKIGSYDLIYTVKDKSGNTTKKKRQVKVVKRGQEGTIYLTFDDGPRMGTTNVILDVLKEEGIKATFFVTNSGPDELIIREYTEGHTVGLHTASHDYSYIYANKENYFNDLNLVHDRVFNLTGYDSKIIRFPGGSSNTISRRYHMGIMSELTREVLTKDFRYYDWNINSRDTDGLTTSTDIYQQVIAHLSHDKVNVVLMHDVKPYTRDAVKDIIRYGKENGYSFEAITNETEMVMQRVNN